MKVARCRVALLRWAFAIAIAALPSTVAAQQGDDRFAALFGITPERASREYTLLDFRGGTGGGWEDGLILNRSLGDDDPGLASSPANRASFAGGGEATLAFVRQTSMSRFAIGGSAIYREYFAKPLSFGATTEIANVNYRVSPTTRLRFDANAGFSRLPFFQVLPSSLYETTDEIAPPSTPSLLLMLPNDNLNAHTGLSYSTSKRSSFSASVTTSRVRFDSLSGSDFDALRAEGGFRYQLTRDLAARVGYSREDYRTNRLIAGHYINERFDVGVDYTREISLARRTTFGFSTQTAMVKEANPGPNAGRRFQINGDVSLTRRFQRTWRAMLAAQRSTDFIPGFFEPAFSDTASAAIGGMLNRRTRWILRAGGGRGRFGFDRAGPTYTTAVASTRLSVALSRHLGAHVAYAFMDYRVPATALNSVTTIGKMSRQSVSLGFNLWLPIYSEVKESLGPQ